MAVRYQLVINCVGHPEPLARFWAEALGYVLEPPQAVRHLGRLAARHRAARVLARPGDGLHHRSGWRRTPHLDPGRARPQDH